MAQLLDRHRILAYSRVLLVAEILVSLYFVAATHGLIWRLDAPVTTDFVSFYAAGSLTDAGTANLAYQHAAHYAAEQRATAAGIDYNYFYYPPVFLLICAALARLPYVAAFLAFEAVTLALYLIATRQVLGERGWAALVPLLAFPAVFWNIGLGQNALLTAALFGGATLLVDRRPTLAGLLFGALCYKPHFGLLVPVALAAGRRWRAFAAAAAAVAALVLLSLALFGWTTWHDFIAATGRSLVTYQSGGAKLTGFVSPFGAVLLVGGSPALAYAVQAGFTLAAGALVGLVWARRAALPVRAATLIAATLVAVPVALYYDLALAAVATAWLVRAGDVAAWERLVLGVLFLVPLDVVDLAQSWHLPIAALGTLAFAALVARRAVGEAVRPAASGPGRARRAATDIEAA